jgi:hypothetical protein
MGPHIFFFLEAQKTSYCFLYYCKKKEKKPSLSWYGYQPRAGKKKSKKYKKHTRIKYDLAKLVTYWLSVLFSSDMWSLPLSSIESSPSGPASSPTPTPAVPEHLVWGPMTMAAANVAAAPDTPSVREVYAAQEPARCRLRYCSPPFLVLKNWLPGNNWLRHLPFSSFFLRPGDTDRLGGRPRQDSVPDGDRQVAISLRREMDGVVLPP